MPINILYRQAKIGQCRHIRTSVGTRIGNLNYLFQNGNFGMCLHAANSGLVLADVVSPDRQGGVVGRPVVGAEQAHAPGLQTRQQAVEGGLVALTALPVDQPAGAALERLPDPELPCLFSTKCQSSSISTTAVLPVGSGLGQCRCA